MEKQYKSYKNLEKRINTKIKKYGKNILLSKTFIYFQNILL